MLSFASKGITIGKNSVVGPSDPSFSSVSVLMHMDGSNGQTTTTDVKGHAVTIQSQASLSTTQKKFGSTSLAVTGSTSSYATVACAATTTTDFTLECWVYFSSIGSNNIFLDCRPAVNGVYFTLAQLGGVWAYYTNSATQISGGTPATNTWYHVALCRSSGTTRLFVDGVLIGSFTDSLNYGAATFNLGLDSQAPAAGFNLNGYIDDFRYTPGVARYTANFTPPAAAFPDH